MWFWIVSAIAGSILGGATESWFRGTRPGIWFYTKIDRLYTWANNKYGLKIFTNEQERMKKFPMLEKRLQEIERRLDNETI